MSRTLPEVQNAFHEKLTRYVNGGFAARSNLLVSLLAPGVAYRREAPALVAQFRATAPSRTAAAPTAPVRVEVPLYTGGNRHALQMMRELVPLAPWLAGAYVHGSIATGEEVAYSDFDALVILRDDIFGSADTLSQVACQLGRLRRLMVEYDPLQHHGWFVLAEGDLRQYCDAWFPTPLFAWARSLLPDSGRRLVIHPRDSGAEYRAAFAALASGTLRQIESGPPLRNAYALKGLLSRFMLLPSLYLQARDGTAVFKKQSFALAARDFPPATWASMERVSAVRQQWHYEMSAAQRFAFTRCLAQRHLVTRWLRPAVPADLRAELPPDLWASAAGLIRAMQERVSGVIPRQAAKPR